MPAPGKHKLYTEAAEGERETAMNFNREWGPGQGAVMAPQVRTNSESFDPVVEEARRALLATYSIRDRRLQEALNAIIGNNPGLASRLVFKALAKRPRDPDALHLKAELALRAKRQKEAAEGWHKCVELAPENRLFRFNYASVLAETDTAGEAIVQVEKLLKTDPGNILYRSLEIRALDVQKRYNEALERCRQLTREFPDSPDIWMQFATLLRTTGHDRDECVAALRKAIELSPTCGKFWWMLASLKMFRFTPEELARMEQICARPNLSGEDRFMLNFSIGKAYDDLKDYGKSFSHYLKGNAIRRVGMNYDADYTTAMVTRAEKVFTPEFFQERAGLGCDSDQPIFVLGLQRAGSTLVEQILGSHSVIEPAGELQVLLQIVTEDVILKLGDDYPCGVEKLAAADLKAMGEKYLELTRKYRSTERPRFVDKCPYNFWHIGLLRLILPNAKIIDARRHPIACCYANFTMSFHFGPPLSYSLGEIGRFYADYVRLMAHFDRVIPGKVHRVIYEQVVGELETEVRRLLDHVGLPFETSCLEYYKTERVFNSFSNEQVRSPIFKEGLERWRNYEPWLGQLKTALGPILDAYPGVPDFAPTGLPVGAGGAIH
jgi:tetratricopeptide (TPR) repeat protein